MQAKRFDHEQLNLIVYKEGRSWIVREIKDAKEAVIGHFATKALAEKRAQSYKTSKGIRNTKIFVL